MSVLKKFFIEAVCCRFGGNHGLKLERSQACSLQHSPAELLPDPQSTDVSYVTPSHGSQRTAKPRRVGPGIHALPRATLLTGVAGENPTRPAQPLARARIPGEEAGTDQ